MRRSLADWFNTRGNGAAAEGLRQRALRFYSWAARLDPSWSVPYFNLGLHTKYLCNWHDSLRYNQRATDLNDEDEGAWWNLGIAATALEDWTNSRRAWKRLGIEVAAGDGEWIGPPVTACVRLGPDRGGEVVWGERLDPARLIILNIPLPESGHRFKDVVLHDGAANGRRVIDGVEVPVFDELQLWRASSYSTYEVNLEVSDVDAEALLAELCGHRELGLEDWSTVRSLCEQCSRGNPGPHECKDDERDNFKKRYAIASKAESDVRAVLEDWMRRTEGTRCLSIDLVMPAR